MSIASPINALSILIEEKIVEVNDQLAITASHFPYLDNVSFIFIIFIIIIIIIIFLFLLFLLLLLLLLLFYFSLLLLILPTWWLIITLN